MPANEQNGRDKPRMATGGMVARAGIEPATRGFSVRRTAALPARKPKTPQSLPARAGRHCFRPNPCRPRRTGWRLRRTTGQRAQRVTASRPNCNRPVSRSLSSRQPKPSFETSGPPRFLVFMVYGCSPALRYTVLATAHGASNAPPVGISAAAAASSVIMRDRLRRQPYEGLD